MKELLLYLCLFITLKRVYTNNSSEHTKGLANQKEVKTTKRLSRRYRVALEWGTLDRDSLSGGSEEKEQASKRTFIQRRKLFARSHTPCIWD